MLRTEVVTDLAGLEALAAPWEELLLRSPGSTAFASPGYVLTWYRHFERPGGIYAIAVRRGDELVGLAPYAQSRLGGRRGFRLLVSAGTEHGDYGEPLLGPNPGPVAAAIAEHLSELVRGRSVAVNLRRLYDGGPMLRALAERDDIVRRPMGLVAHATLVRFDALDDPEAYLDRLARRHSIPRRMRRLREAHGDVTYVVDSPDVDAALDAMRDMLRARWAPGTGPRIFATPRLEAFTRAVIHTLVDADQGRVSTLDADGRPVAATSVFRVGDRYISDNAAFEPALAKYGLGQAELYETLRHSLAEGAAEVDLRAGDFPYKAKWGNDERVTRSIVVTAPGKVGEVALAARRVAMSMRARRMGRRVRQASQSNKSA